MDIEILENKIKEITGDAEIFVTGDGRHFHAKIISREFSNKSLLERHQRVMSGLKKALESDLHALSLETLSPEEV